MSREQSQFVLEIGFQPNAKVLDHRGKWAESVAAQMSLGIAQVSVESSGSLVNHFTTPSSV